MSPSYLVCFATLVTLCSLFLQNPQTCVLKVNIHCDGCQKKVKKILHKIEGEDKVFKIKLLQLFIIICPFYFIFSLTEIR
jgi:hypothetical protein